MDLQLLKLDHFRRFASVSTLQLSGKLTALVGPNEAGKTSVLDALLHLGHDGPLASLDVTRGSNDKPNYLITGRFYLDDDDRKALSSIPNGMKVRWLTIFKGTGGKRKYELEPGLPRDLAPRQRAAKHIKKTLGHQKIKKLEGESESFTRTAFEDLQDILRSKLNSLSPEDIIRIREVLNI